MSEESKQAADVERISVKEFFERIPPGRNVLVKNMSRKEMATNYKANWYLQLPVIKLHCETEACNGLRFFEPIHSPLLRSRDWEGNFVTYVCRNCGQTMKTYALWSRLAEDTVNGELYKFGEHPPFGPPTPRRLLSLIGPEKEYYLKGRRAENQDLGIAAFAYYRRVVESQKNRIFDEIVKVSQKIGAPNDVIEELRAAKEETQFSKAVEVIKHSLPQALLLNGHNPLTLLHSALSKGLHAQTDEQCLELATSIRVVLTELIDMLATTLKEKAELNAAVSRLFRPNGSKA